MKSRVLVQVTAPHFCAGLVLDHTGTCTEAAPILRWAIGWRWVSLAHYFTQKGWRWTTTPDPPSITCPKCKRVSYHPKDIRHRFCAVCGYHDEIPSA